MGVLRNREERQRLASEKSHILPTFSQILEHVDMDTMSLDEQSVIVECNRVAFWKFSLPCMIASSGSTLLMFEKGFLQSRPSASYPRLPKLFLAALVGYTGGQVTYRNIMRQFLILKWKQYFVELFSSRCYMHTAKTAAEDCWSKLQKDLLPRGSPCPPPLHIRCMADVYQTDSFCSYQPVTDTFYGCLFVKTLLQPLTGGVL